MYSFQLQIYILSVNIFWGPLCLKVKIPDTKNCEEVPDLPYFLKLVNLLDNYWSTYFRYADAKWSCKLSVRNYFFLNCSNPMAPHLLWPKNHDKPKVETGVFFHILRYILSLSILKLIEKTKQNKIMWDDDLVLSISFGLDGGSSEVPEVLFLTFC